MFGNNDKKSVSACSVQMHPSLSLIGVSLGANRISKCWVSGCKGWGTWTFSTDRVLCVHDKGGKNSRVRIQQSRAGVEILNLHKKTKGC